MKTTAPIPSKKRLEELLKMGLNFKQIAQASQVTIAVLRYCFKLYGLSMRKPRYSDSNRAHRGHLCRECGDTKPGNFYRGDRKRYMCKKCYDAQVMARRWDHRRKVLELLGGKCTMCGFSKWDCSLEVHHINPVDKDPQFSEFRQWSWNRIVEEIRGCVLLCSNCHAAVHAGLVTLASTPKKSKRNRAPA